MTEVREGDRIRLTFEGTVIRVGDAVVTIKTDSGDRSFSRATDIPIDLLERASPSAFPAGSVVKSKGGNVAFRQPGGWVWADGEGSLFDDEEFRRLVSKGIAEVLYEPAS